MVNEEGGLFHKQCVREAAELAEFHAESQAWYDNPGYENESDYEDEAERYVYERCKREDEAERYATLLRETDSESDEVCGP